MEINNEYKLQFLLKKKFKDFKIITNRIIFIQKLFKAMN